MNVAVEHVDNVVADVAVAVDDAADDADVVDVVVVYVLKMIDETHYDNCCFDHQEEKVKTSWKKLK